MNNMGRLFQYNRFGNTNNNTDKKLHLARNNSKMKEQTTTATNRICPAYSEVYPEYINEARITTAAIPTKLTNDNTNSMLLTISSTSTAVTTPATVMTMTTSKRLELAIKKYQQWSSKLMPTTASVAEAAAVAATTTTTRTQCSNITHLSVTSTSTTSSSTTSLASCSAATATCSASSGYHSRKLENDREMLVTATAVKRPKVYDCMKDFLRRKLFQQNAAAVVAEAKIPKPADVGEDMVDGKSETEEDVTSDYDEIDTLDSSYNADEEDNSSNCSCVVDEDETINEVMHSTMTPSSHSPLKSALSLNCWQNSSSYTDSTTEEELEADDYTEEEETEDSDAGISDCCQLIGEKKSPKHKSAKIRYNHNVDDDEDELLESSWYQPRITTKAVFEYLQQAEPGSFLVRRKSRTLELCVRVPSSKVKYFTVVATAEANYKLKGAKKQFSSLRALVTHHSVMAEQLPVTLILPRDGKWLEEREKMLPASIRYADDFDTFESLQILGILKSLQAKSFEFS